MNNIKQETIDAIKSSAINVSFDKCGNKHKISFTFYDSVYAYTLTACATISHSKYMRLSSYAVLMDTLKPCDFEGERICKETGFAQNSSNKVKNRAVFSLLCDELASRTDTVEMGYMVRYPARKP